MNFSVEIHHGGVFCGIGADRAYFGGQSDWFDYVDADSWSYFWIDEFIMLLGYGISPSNLKVYWLLPGKELSDGLRILASDPAKATVARRISGWMPAWAVWTGSGIVKQVWGDVCMFCTYRDRNLLLFISSRFNTPCM